MAVGTHQLQRWSPSFSMSPDLMTNCLFSLSTLFDGYPSDLAVRRGIDRILWANILENPDCPREPGRSGSLNTGLGKDELSFSIPEERHIFVGTTSEERLEYTYIGKYRCIRCQSHDPDKWKERTEEVSNLTLCPSMGVSL